MSSEKQSGFQSFTSLVWYDQFIDLLFRFVAKTSELLLAAGVIVSAADFLSKGRVMQGNLLLADGWAWTQAIAIESSGGVVLLYALQAFKEKDAIKARLYLILASLLAIVGGVMLFTQIASNTTGIDIVANGPGWFVYGMAVLRSIVSIAYIVMCRTKHIRFSGLIAAVDSQQIAAPDIASILDERIQAALATALQTLQAEYRQQFDVTIQEVRRTFTEEITQHRLIAMPKEVATSKSGVVDSSPASRRLAKPVAIDRHFDRLAAIKSALIADPAIIDKELAKVGRCSINTARSDKKKALAEIARLQAK